MVWAMVGVVVVAVVVFMEHTLGHLNDPEPNDYGHEVQRMLRTFPTLEEERKALRDITVTTRVGEAMLLTVGLFMFIVSFTAPKVLDSVIVMIGIAVWVMTATVVLLWKIEKYRPPHREES